MATDDLIDLVVEFADDDASSESLSAACKAAFAAVHRGLIAPAAQTTAGTTSTLVVINEARAEIVCASVGDSYAVLFSSDVSVPPTFIGSYDRLSDNDNERTRVKEMGGTVARARNSSGNPAGPLRAWPGGVACAKALGDSDCPVISAAPTIHVVPFPASGAVVLASDGVWDAVSFATAREILVKSNDPAHAAERLVERAIRGERGLRDDTSCIVVLCARRNDAAAEGEVEPESTGDGRSGWSVVDYVEAEEIEMARSPWQLRRALPDGDLDADEAAQGASSLSSSPSRRRSGASAILRMMPSMMTRRCSDPSMKAGKFFAPFLAPSPTPSVSSASQPPSPVATPPLIRQPPGGGPRPGAMQRNAHSLPYHLDRMTVAEAPPNDHSPVSVVASLRRITSFSEGGSSEPPEWFQEATKDSPTWSQDGQLEVPADERRANVTYRAGRRASAPPSIVPPPLPPTTRREGRRACSPAVIASTSEQPTPGGSPRHRRSGIAAHALLHRLTEEHF